MQINAFRYFLETASTGSIRKAAERLHVTATAVGRQIENLEQYVNAPLFERSARGIRLTPAGEVLMGRVAPLMRDLEDIKGDILDLRGLRKGTVSIFAAEALVTGFLVKAIGEFRSDFPGITFNIGLAGADQTFEALRADKVDIGFMFNAPRRPDIDVLASANLVHVAVVSPRHALAHRKRIRLTELASYPLVIPETTFGARRAVDRAARAEGTRIEPAYVANSLIVMKELAQSGTAVAFVPLLSVEYEVEHGLLVPIRIDNKILETVEVSIAVHKGRRLSFSTMKFLEAASAALSDVRKQGRRGTANSLTSL